MSLSRPCRLTDLSWVDIRDHLQRDDRLLVPVGTSDQYGPHLPLGAGTYITEAVVRELAADFDVLVAPTVSYGVNLPGERPYAGTASLREKTLHQLLNDLLAQWEDHGFSEFILLTAQRYDPHVEAIATVSGTRARVRVIELLEIDVSQFLDGRGGAEHGGEAMTSLMLYLHPDKVNLARAEDYFLTGPDDPPPLRIDKLPELCPGNVGQPTLATREKGERIFRYIVQKIRTKVFLSPREAG
ncbi:MAG TPA: creatininase family protein [Longimicrobiaceae bacterium]|nr:creatininase family protein [Longimicrobiaceae bacterium]